MNRIDTTAATANNSNDNNKRNEQNNSSNNNNGNKIIRGTTTPAVTNSYEQQHNRTVAQNRIVKQTLQIRFKYNRTLLLQHTIASFQYHIVQYTAFLLVQTAPFDWRMIRSFVLLLNKILRLGQDSSPKVRNPKISLSPNKIYNKKYFFFVFYIHIRKNRAIQKILRLA